MAIKKSELYRSLWQSCDELRGGMDASQYKDYVLFMLFIKYISDKYADSDDFAPPVTIPAGAGFKDMLELRGKDGIGDKINTQIIQPLIDANVRLARSDFPDFNDPNKLGEGKAMVERLTNLVNIFNTPTMDFSKNRADHDDILGDAYEYLMRHFAQESGKSKGQFYTPSEVSRIIAKVIGIAPENAIASTTAYDPTCGSGSLLLKVAAEAGRHITLEGQEMDVTTAGLARMNMILHDFPTANILQGNTLSNPKFKDGEKLRTYDYVVANPPFSDKTWSTGLTPANDPFQRFAWGEPPGKQGDYAYLLHIIRSIKSEGKGACILPHGVLFRGNAEAVIRREMVRSGCLKGIIGLPANLFYGTGIPACILVIDKENAPARKGVFMIDASKGFIKDGNKNRLREQDIHKIVDIFTRQEDTPRFARMVPFDEIADARNDYNLNLPRYIDSSDPEDIQDIDGHLRGGIPERDIAIIIINNHPVGAGPRACPNSDPVPNSNPVPNSDPAPNPNDPRDDCGHPCGGDGQARGPAPTELRSTELRSTELRSTNAQPTVGLSLPDVVHRFKTMTTTRYIDGVKQHGWPRFSGKLWQRNYWEHIVRNEPELNRVREYIRDNPVKWELDSLRESSSDNLNEIRERSVEYTSEAWMV